MFKQLTYFQSLDGELRILEQKSQQLNALLDHASSPPHQPYCSLPQHIEAVLLEENHLQEVASVILQQLVSNTFIPHRLHPPQLEQMLPSSFPLPQWFPHVLQTEFSKAKPQLDRFARNLATMHGLQEKRKVTREERKSLEILYRRMLSIAAYEKQNFTQIDIMQDVSNLQERVKHVRKTLRHFCAQIASKVRDFASELIEKSANFNKLGFPRVSLRGVNRKVEDIFQIRHHMHRMSPLQADLPNESYKMYNLYPRSKIDTFGGLRGQVQNEKGEEFLKEKPRLENYLDYYGLAQKIALANQPNHHSPRQRFRQGIGLEYNQPKCLNHYEDAHRHTCARGGWLRQVKSEERVGLGVSPVHSDRYNYRRVIPESNYY